MKIRKLALEIPWHEFDKASGIHYTKAPGALSKPIRLMVGLLIRKPLENLSDEVVVLQWKHNPHYQAFCCMKEFQRRLPFHSAELLRFCKRIGAEGVERIFQMSVGLHGKVALEDAVLFDTTIQEKTSPIRQTESLQSKSLIVCTRLPKCMAFYNSAQLSRQSNHCVWNLKQWLLTIFGYFSLKKYSNSKQCLPLCG